MSDSNQTLSTEEAFENVYHGVHKRAFFHRLAQHGIVPQSEKEAEELLDIGSKVELAAATKASQPAVAHESRFTKANSDLGTAMTAQGILAPEKQAAEPNGPSPEAQAAAWDLAQDPVLFKSAEILQAANGETEPVAAGETE
jgi:hypothetical protein